MDVLFKRSLYTVTESEFHHDVVPNTSFLPESSMNMIIETSVHILLLGSRMCPDKCTIRSSMLCATEMASKLLLLIFVELALSLTQTLETGFSYRNAY